MTTAPQAPLAGAGATSSAQANEPTMSLRALIERYMAAYAGRDSTRVSQLVRWDALLGERPFASLTDEDVFQGLERLRSEPARVYVGKDVDGAPIHRARRPARSAATINRYHAALSAVFTWAGRRRLTPRGWENPCRKLERAPEKSAVVRFLSDAECGRLLASCKESTWPRLYLLVLMAITTGARRGELLALTWADVDLERGIAHVRSSKNDQPRALPLVPVVAAELRRFAIERPEACIGWIGA